MSGSNTICFSTVLLVSGMIQMQEPETEFFLEAPAGLVHVKANYWKVLRQAKLNQLFHPLAVGDG